MSSILLLTTLALSTADPTPPHVGDEGDDFPGTRRGEQVEARHGLETPDPYRWLETDSRETQDWVRRQDALLRDHVGDDPRREEIARLVDRYHEGSAVPIPRRAGGRWFFVDDPDDRPHDILWVQDGEDGEPRILLDPGTGAAAQVLEPQGVAPSPSGRFVAVGQGNSTVVVLDVDRGERLSDRVDGSTGTRGVSWTPDDAGFFYVVDPGVGREPAPPEPSGPSVRFHTLGTDRSEDLLVHAEEDPELGLSGHVGDEGRWLVVTVTAAHGYADRVLRYDLRDLDAEPLVLIEHDDARSSFLGNEGDRLFFWSEHEAPKGRVIAVDASRPEEVEVVVPEFEEASAGGSLAGGNALGLHGDRLVLLYYRDVLPIVRVFDLEGTLQHEIEQDVVGTIYSGFHGTRHDPVMFYEVDTAFDPGTVKTLNLHTGEDSVYGEALGLPYDLFDFEMSHGVAEADDGARIPLLICHRADQDPDGSAPCWMYGYGSSQWVAFAWRQPWIVAWIQMGGVYVVPGIRGGGEHGREWAHAGAGRHGKSVAIDDFNSAGQWLLENGWCAEGKLVADGWSLSGSLAAAAVQRRPELYGAALIGLPTLDLLRAHHYRHVGPAYEHEFGRLDDPEDYAALAAWSPVHNARPAEYPATLVWCGEMDATPPLHSYKFVAATQHAQRGDAPVLLQLIRGGGHSLGRNRRQTVQSATDQLCFLLKALDFEPDLGTR